MRIINKQILLFALPLLAFASCKKDNQATVPLEVTDTLAQSTYTVNRADDARTDGSIALAPYNFTNPRDSGDVMVMDGDGHLLMQQRTQGAALNFRRWLINGELRYTWSVYDVNSYTIPGISQMTGYTVIADDHLHEIRRVTLVNHNDITTTKNEGTDVHDFILLSDDHYIAMAYYQKTVTNIPANLASTGRAQVVAPIIQEVNAGQVVWQWDGTDYPEFYSTSVETNDFSDVGTTQDYMHMNSMTIDPRDNNLICSFRNLNQILKINRQTGAIVWRLGGSNSDFPLDADQKFLRQHHVTLTDNNQTLLVFDNGEATERPYTRILEFQLNEDAKKVIGFRSFNVPEPFTQYMGSVQKINDHYFIGGGTAKYVLEVNYLTGEKVLEMNGSEATYRAFKY